MMQNGAKKEEDWRHKMLRFDLERLASNLRNVAGEMDRQGFGRDQILRLRSMAAEVTEWAGDVDVDDGGRDADQAAKPPLPPPPPPKRLIREDVQWADFLPLHRTAKEE